MIDKVNKLIVFLVALANYSKDLHYSVKGPAMYGKHIFADLLEDDIYGFIDDLKENILLGSHVEPLASKKYLELAVEEIPDVNPDDKVNFERIAALVEKTRNFADGIKFEKRGYNSLIDGVCEHLDKCAGLLWLQVKDNKLEESFKKEECEGEDEKPVDRKEAKRTPIDYDKVADTVRKYEDENLLVAENEGTLDKLSKKLGI